MNAQPPQTSRDRSSPRPGRLQIVTVVVLALAAMGLAATKVHSADVFWHLACGEWMVANQQVLDHDPFSLEGGRWLNVHWLFQVILAAAHGLGGWATLGVLKTACITALAALFALALIRHSPPGWVVFCGLAMLLLASSRFRVRPEMMTMVLLMGLIALLEGARREPRALWLWPPAALMLLWANMQGVYLVGLGLIWAQVLAAPVDRQWRGAVPNRLAGPAAWGAALAATATCLMTPWHVEGLIHPFVLWSRISGQEVYYTYGVAELAPTWRNLPQHLDMVAMVGLTLVALAASQRRVPLAHWLWMAAFTVLALLAQRNIGLAAPVWAYLLALHGGDVLRRMGRSAPKLRPFAAGFTIAAVGAAVAVSALGASGALRAWRGSAVQPGLGLLEYAYPTQAAKKLERLTVAGDVFCTDFGQAGTFIYYSGPRSQEPVRRVFMDGRLEAHNIETFIEYRRIRRELSAPASASAAELPAPLRFFQVPADRGNQLSALGQSMRFDLLHVEPAGALFARNDWNGGPAAWRLSDRLAPLAADPTRPANNLAWYDLPLGPDGGLDGPFPRPRARWYAMNPPTIYYRMGSVLLSLAQRQDWSQPDAVAEKCGVLALRYLTEGRRIGIVEAQIATGRLAQAFQERALQEQVILPDTSAPFDRMLLDLHLARSLYLFDRMPLTPMDLDVLALGVSSVQARVHGFQFDLAQQRVEEIGDRLPARMRMELPRQLTQLRDRIAGPVGQAIIDTRGGAFRSLSPREQAIKLASPQMRLFGEAIDRLTSQGETDPGNALLLGDLLLQTGRPHQARKAYAAIGASHRDAPAARARLLLCRWVAGELAEPADLTARLAEATDSDAARYYASLMLETSGHYARALEIITPARGESRQAQRLIDTLRERLVRAAAW